MRLPLPEGFTPPANSRPGEPFEVVATIKPEEGGFMLVAIDGIRLPEDEDEEGEVDERVDASKVSIPFGEEESDEYA